MNKDSEIKEQAHKEFDEKLPQMITDLIWAVTDGGQRIEPNRFLSYQEEPIYEFERIKYFLDSLIDKTVQKTEERIVEENQDSDSIEKHERLVEAIKNKEDIFVSENGYALSLEDYYNFEEWVESVGKPEGSTVEKFTRYTITNKSELSTNKDEK